MARVAAARGPVLPFGVGPIDHLLAVGGLDFLKALRGETQIDWTFFSPAALIEEGPRLGHYRTGGDQLLTDANGDSKISFADYAIAMVDELEQHKHSRARFTAAY